MPFDASRTVNSAPLEAECAVAVKRSVIRAVGGQPRAAARVIVWAVWAAHVDGRIWIRGAQQLSRVRPPGGVAAGEVQEDSRVILEFACEGRLLTAADDVVQCVVASRLVESLRHGEQGGYPDTAGEHDVPRGVGETEMLARDGNVEPVPHGECVHGPGASAGGIRKQHGDAVATALARWTTQRILADDTVRTDPYIDMGTCLVGREPTALRRFEVEDRDPRGHVPTGHHYDASPAGAHRDHPRLRPMSP
jgi:hypothetical protein